ncbi:MAG TPA: hypothetical protein VFT22_17185 [Kofleriaceae bacterium]|nr:hypothetical protein [Kofleriaceae bacterium]
MRLAIALTTLAVIAPTASAGDAHVTAITTTTMYIDAGTADGLAAGAAWQATVGGRAVSVKVVAVASHDAVLELDGTPPAVGATIALPPGLAPPAPVVLRPAPAPSPVWRDDPGALGRVRIAASHEQPAPPPASEETRISGELALSTFVAADTTNSSTSWEDIALASQLSVERGAWRYDHLLEAHLAGSPEVVVAPLQHAQARFDVYLMRLSYAPAGAAYAAAIGRLPGSSLAELGAVDGAQGHVALGPRLDATAFAGLRPASDLGLSLAPRAGADLGWHVTTVDGLHARVDAGAAVDEYKGSLDRAQTAASATLTTPALLAHGDAVVDLASDAAGKAGARVSRAAGLVRGRRGRLTASLQAGYDRPFLDRALVAELPDLSLGPRTFGAVDATYALSRGLDLGGSARISRGGGMTSAYADLVTTWYAPDRTWYVTVAPHAIVGSLVDELGVRGDLVLPFAAWSLGAGGSFDRVSAGGELAWAGIGRLSGSRSFLHRWRTSLSFEVAAGDGPPRVFGFALLGYRLGR